MYGRILRRYAPSVPRILGIQSDGINIATRYQLAPISRPGKLSFKRYKSWFQSLGKVKNSRKAKESELRTLDNKTVIIEDEDPNQVATEQLDQLKDPVLWDINHILKTTDMPDRLRQKILTEKLTKLVQDYEFNNPVMFLVNGVFMELYKLNKYVVITMKNGKIDNTGQSVLNQNQLMQLLDKSLTLLMNNDQPESLLTSSLPEYLSVLIQFVLSNDMPINDSILVRITLFSSKLNNNNFNLADTLLLLIKSKKITSEAFINELIETLSFQGKLNFQSFETIGQFNSTISPSNSLKLNDKFYLALIDYIKQLLENNIPKTHEYENLELNMFRIQKCALELVDQCPVEQLEIGTLLQLANLVGELNSANHYPDTPKVLKKILEYFNKLENHKKVTDSFLRQEYSDDLVIDNFISILLANDGFSLLQLLMDSVLKNSVVYLKERLIQSRVFFLLNTKGNYSESELSDAVIEKIEPEIISDTEQSIDLTKLYLQIIQISVSGKAVSPDGDFIAKLDDFFTSKGMEIHILSYKLRIDRAIHDLDQPAALKIFNESINNLMQWTSQDQEFTLQIRQTLNDLIILSCKQVNDIGELFNFFILIKQQMSNDSINIYSIIELSQRMLGAEYVGDCIEMLKRELPAIDKDSSIKLPANEPFAFAYRKLFDILHEFVITYNNEKTHETNWVLYGELHKYFHVPFESYLPAMKFFCESNRLNAALIIFRQIRRLHEAHGNHNHLPPLKEMYMYLFKEFGDNLYEEGVEEIHEYLKLDVSLPRQDIELINSILNAYSNLQDVSRVRDIFLSASPSSKIEGGSSGVNEKTIQIMIKTYTYADINYVKSFWNNLSSFGIIPNYDIFKQYLIAHVYHGLPEDAIEIAGEMDDYGLAVREDTLVSMYNFCLSPNDQIKVENWAKSEHKEAWESIVSKNLLKRTDDYMPDGNILIEGEKGVTSQ